MTSYHHLRRLYIDQPLTGKIILTDNQHHYLRNVMRVQPGDHFRAFHVKQGEYLAEIIDVRKKEIIAQGTEQLRPAPDRQHRWTLIMPTLTKEAMQWGIQKATELGMTQFQPIRCDRSENHKVRDDKVAAWCIEATEQCERLDVPDMLPVLSLQEAITKQENVVAAIERTSDTLSLLSALKKTKKIDTMSILVGPAGGFSDQEKEWLQQQDTVTAVDLGPRILRAETAAIMMLSVLGSIDADQRG